MESKRPELSSESQFFVILGHLAKICIKTETWAESAPPAYNVIPEPSPERVKNFGSTELL